MPTKLRTKDFDRFTTGDGSLDKITEHQMCSKFKNGLTFNEPSEFDCLGCLTNLETCEDIFQHGLSLNSSNETLAICNDFHLDIDGILEICPMKKNGNFNGVLFTMPELKFLALQRFYFLEIFGDGKVSILRIFVTHNTHADLKKFNPFLETRSPSKAGTLPIVFFKGKWYQYNNVTSSNGKKTKLIVHFILDSVPPQSKIPCKYFPTDYENLIDIFSFFALLSNYNGNHNIVYEGDRKLLCKMITSVSHCRYNTSEVVNTHPFVDKIDCVNKALCSINFGLAFDTGSIQSCNIKHVNAMDLVFLKTQKIPYPQTMFNVIMKGINAMEKEEKSFHEIFAIFLKHFLTQEAKLTVQSNLISYLNSL